MLHIWDTMKSSIRAGLNDDGVLPGGLDVLKKAKHLYSLNRFDELTETKEFRLVSAYAFAVSEQNACGKTVVTAPTCGSAGVVPAVLYYQQQKHGFDKGEGIRHPFQFLRRPQPSVPPLLRRSQPSAQRLKSRPRFFLLCMFAVPPVTEQS